MIKLVLLDIDGTLLSCGVAAKRAFAEAAAAVLELPRGTDVSGGVDYAGRTDLGILGQIFTKHQRKMSPELVAAFWPRYLAALEQWLTLHPPTVYPGARELPEKLRARGLVVGLLTGNHSGGARLKLAAGDFDGALDWGGFGDAHIERAPLLPLALAAADAATGDSFTAAQTLLIGDTPHDIACARAHGAKAAVVTTGFFGRAALAEHKPDYLLESLEQLSARGL
jgi:phosphoglycolate phosphatase-like HAD superfamily hydrolase